MRAGGSGRKLFVSAVILAAATAVWAGGPAVRQKPQTIVAPTTRCEIAAYIVDPDPQGLNVRTGPGKQFGVIASIPRGENGVVVSVTGASGDWVLIEGADPMDEVQLYKGAGWAYATLLGLDTTAGERELANENYPVPVYRAPDRKSGVVGKIAAQTPVTLTGCRGSWARIRYKQIEGWLPKDAQCANPVSVCIN